MGSATEFNWVLRLRSLEGITEGNINSFEKSGDHVFPLQMPIFLIGPDWDTVAIAKIIKYEHGPDGITGTYKVLRLLTPLEREVMTSLHRGMYAKS